MHHNFDDSDSGYDVDNDRTKPLGVGGLAAAATKGRTIFLGDGTEVMTDTSSNDDTEMVDGAEDNDLASQVLKSSSSEEEAPAAKESPPKM